MMDTPLPLAGTAPSNTSSRNKGGSAGMKVVHPRPHRAEETVYLLPRLWLRRWIRWARSVIVESSVEIFFAEEWGASPQPRQSSEQYQPESQQQQPQQQEQGPPHISKRTYSFCPEALKALAALSVLANQYEFNDDTEGEWSNWLGTLEGCWKDWNEAMKKWRRQNSHDMRQEASAMPLPPPFPHLGFPRHPPPGPIDGRMLSMDRSLRMHRDVALTMRGLAHAAAPDSVLEDEMDEEALRTFFDGLRISAANNNRALGDGAGKKLAVCPVPGAFYECVRSTKGVYCANGDVSFATPLVDEMSMAANQPSGTTGDEDVHDGGSRPSSLLFHDQWMANDPTSSTQHPHLLHTHPRPIEFRRRVLSTLSVKDDGNQSIGGTPQKSKPSYSQVMQDALKSRNGSSKEDDLVDDGRGYTVEVFPVEFRYAIVDYGTATSSAATNGESASDNARQGVALASRCSPVHDVLHDLGRTAAPHCASTCARLWMRSRSGDATTRGDGYDLLDMESLSPTPTAREVNRSPQKATTRSPKSKPEAKPPLTVEKWLGLEEFSAETNSSGSVVVDLLVEIRSSPTTCWPRESLELVNRLQVGDFVDAQDGARKWYEAVVRAVTPDTVKVHYFGWGSRWDTDLPRRKGTNAKLSPPMPLWTKSARWREQIKVGDEVEVRESTSLVQRPKWHRAVVLAVGSEADVPRELQGGAKLEELEDNGLGRKVPLMLMKRKRQILVEVPQEIHNCPSAPLTSPKNDAKPVAHPPFRRWVNLFGEEICKVNTHKTAKKETNSTATLNYTMESRRQPVEVMKPFNNIHGSGFVRESLRGIPPASGTVGLHNLGNSCYMNSILQCINHIKPITQYFLEGEYTKEINKNNPLGSGGRVATAYANFLNDIYSGEYSILAPRLLKQTVSCFAPQFNNNYQHDSQEFCQYLFDGLHEDLNRVKEKPYVEHMEALGMEDSKAAMESWQKHLLRHDSIFVDYTQGMHRSHLTCPSCGKESIKFDVYSSISLPLVPAKDRPTIPLKDCLDQFAAGEQLDEHNAWYCSGCKKHVCALKLITLWTTPDILVLHLKRFTFEKCPSIDGRILRRKIEDTVDFPIDRLDLSKYVLGPKDPNAPPVYKLFGVSEHTGTTANSGHYTATVRNSEDGNWYRYNDSHVGSTSGDAAVTGGAYLLFYQRIKGSLRWAGMENEMAKQGITPAGEDADGFRVVTKKKKRP